MNYTNYQVLDFALDESFQQWVCNPSPSQDSFWTQWVLDHPEKKAVILEARELVLQLGADTDEPTLEEFQNVWYNIEKANQTSERFAYNHQLQKASARYSWQIAAVFVVIISATAFLYFFLQSPKEQTYSTKFGETKTIVLPDRSEVKLNSNSSLSFQADWSKQSSREIWLKGEAYFSVIPKENKQKFIVHVDNVAVEVLGTKFNVSDRHGKTQVVLNSGKVRLNLSNNYLNKATAHQENNLLMQPGELVEITHTGKSFIQKNVDPEVYTAWKDNKFIFQDTPLAEITQLLNDNYGLNIVVQDTALASRKFTSTYTTKDVNVLLKALEKSFNLEIKKSDDKIFLVAPMREPAK